MFAQNYNLKMKSSNYWTYLHDKIQYLLDIHKTQGNKINIFPLDLSFMLDNKWNRQEKDSYKVVCIKKDFEDDNSIDKMISNNIDIICKTRHEIHDKLQYLLDIHHNKNDPFPLDLAYMLDLNITHMDNAYNFDKNYNYNRSFPSYYYSGKLYAVSFLINEEKKPLTQFDFFDLEEFSETFENIEYEPFTNIKNLKIYYNLNNIPDEAPSDYLLWKSSCFDEFYEYKRIHIDEFYNPDKYLPEEKIFEAKEYHGIYDDSEPLYKTFNHFY